MYKTVLRYKADYNVRLVLLSTKNYFTINHTVSHHVKEGHWKRGAAMRWSGSGSDASKVRYKYY